MIKILLTGDLHLGRSYQKEDPEVAARYREARMQALRNAVAVGNGEGCGFLVIAGDLYDKVRGIPATLHREACGALGEFGGHVLVLPGNHDYYSGEGDLLWKKFEEYSPSNTRVLKEGRPYSLGEVDFYPCPCHDKHSAGNALGWLGDGAAGDPARYRVGIAHGALEGLSLDQDQRYYPMTLGELESKGMDVWLLGHTHVPYPPAPEDVPGQRVFNAGTPQQTDMADHATGEVFVIEIAGDKSVRARRRETGVIRFAQRAVEVGRGEDLRRALAFPDPDPAAVSLRVLLSGTAAAGDYEDRQAIYRQAGRGYLSFEVRDSGLRQEITPQMIDRETVPGSLLHRLLAGYGEDAELLDLAFGLMLACKEEG